MTIESTEPNDPAGAGPDAPMTVPQAILHRRSVRSFRPDPIPEDVLQRLVRLTVAAPSSWNFQPWRIVVVRDGERRKQLCGACYGQRQVAEAPVTFVFAVSHTGWRSTLDDVVATAVEKGAWGEDYVEVTRTVAPAMQEGFGDRLREFNVKDALIAATHLVLAAESFGLGSCYMNGYDEAKVKEVIGAGGDDDVGVALVLPVGYPQTRGQDPGRLPPARTVFLDSLDTPWNGPSAG